jgi:hypothetical protein
MDIKHARELLHEFDFIRLFIDVLGWSHAGGHERNWQSMPVKNTKVRWRTIAEMSGVVICEVECGDQELLTQDLRLAVHGSIGRVHHENLLIFLDQGRTKSLWSWIKREGGKASPREHQYLKGQPGDLFLSQLGDLVFTLRDFAQTGQPTVSDVFDRLKRALDVENVTKRFFKEFQNQRSLFLNSISGIADERERRWYASIIINRLMFIFFLQKKHFLDGGNVRYLQDKLTQSKKKGADTFYRTMLKALFFEAFALPESERSPETKRLVGNIRYLNGGLFVEHAIEEMNANIQIPDSAFESLFHLFDGFTWTLSDIPGANDREINPDVLGYIFEKYINQKSFGAYYTPVQITSYLALRTLDRVILDQVNASRTKGKRTFESLDELLRNLDDSICRQLAIDILPNLSVLDPACGSGAFLVAVMRKLEDIYGAVIGRILLSHDSELVNWVKRLQNEHQSVEYTIRRRIISNNIYGVDIMEEAVEIAKLRLFLSLVSAVDTADQMEPLPNVEFNIISGNSLVGLVRVRAEDCGPKDFFRKGFVELNDEQERLIHEFKAADNSRRGLKAMRDRIAKRRMDVESTLNDILLRRFEANGIRHERTSFTEDGEEHIEKRPLTVSDIANLRPIHWEHAFGHVLRDQKGFDVIVTNPPWDAFKPQDKEFFAEYAGVITKNKMRIEDFQKHKRMLLKDLEVRSAYCDYLSRFPHLSLYFRNDPLYENQISKVNGKKTGTDINLYKLFLERCYCLLKDGGQCGIVIPGAIFSDLGSKSLREMLFKKTRLTGSFGFENSKRIFDEVHRSYKFSILTFQKAGKTESFPVAFMRHDVEELNGFPGKNDMQMSVDLIRKSSPLSLSVLELKDDMHMQIAAKMLRFPLLGSNDTSTWNVKFSREFDMTNDSRLFKNTPGRGRLPLYEGKMFHQFDSAFAKPRYWIEEEEGRKALLGRRADQGQTLDYQNWRLAVRAIARGTDSRTLIVGPMPRNVFCGNSALVFCPTVENRPSLESLLVTEALLNSFVCDFYCRIMVSANVNMFYLYQIPVPRIGNTHSVFEGLLKRSLAITLGNKGFEEIGTALKIKITAAKDLDEKTALRAELDAMVAHLYGLSAHEFAYILDTFPLVSPNTRALTLATYRKFSGNHRIAGAHKHAA